MRRIFPCALAIWLLPAGSVVGQVSQPSVRCDDSHLFLSEAITAKVGVETSPTPRTLSIVLEADLTAPNSGLLNQQQSFGWWKPNSDIRFGAISNLYYESRNGSVDSIDGFRAFLSGARRLAADEKLTFVSWLGADLARGYDLSGPSASSQQVFSNWQNRGTQGGVCGPIHSVVAIAARSLGFSDASTGTHTTRWGAAHVLAHLQDPETREYYLVNYGEVIRTGAKDLPTAIAMSQFIWGPQNPTSLVFAGDNRVVLLELPFGSWMRHALADVAWRSGSAVDIALGPFERNASARIEKVVGRTGWAAFYGNTSYSNANMAVTMATTGISMRVREAWPVAVGTRKLRWAVDFAAGRSTVVSPAAPTKRRAQSGSDWFAALSARVASRVVANRVIAKAETSGLAFYGGKQGSLPDIGPPFHWAKAGLEIKASPRFIAEFGRAFQLVYTDKTWEAAQTDVSLTPIYDLISFTAFGRQAESPVRTSVASTQFIFLPTLIAPEAVHWRSMVDSEVVHPRGTVRISGEISGPLRKSVHPMWSTSTAAGMRLEWILPITQRWDLSTSIVVRGLSEPVFYFRNEPSRVWEINPFAGGQRPFNVSAKLQGGW